MARKKRVVIPSRCYHLVSRVAHRAFFFNDDEKRRFTDFLMRVASFRGFGTPVHKRLLHPA